MREPTEKELQALRLFVEGFNRDADNVFPGAGLRFKLNEQGAPLCLEIEMLNDSADEATPARPHTLAPMALSLPLISALNGELRYQSEMIDKGRSDGIDNGLPGQILAIQHYTTKLLEDWTMNPGNEPALQTLRKICATAARGMMAHGIYPRTKK